eukprot:239392_1
MKQSNSFAAIAEHMKQRNNDKKDTNKSNIDVALPKRFFVYGTLRDDDDSGAIWTNEWCKNCIGSNGRLYGYKLYHSKSMSYPFAIKTNNSNDFIVGRILYWNDSDLFKIKLKQADDIEGYNDKNFNNLYQREIVTVINTDNNNTKITAFVYYQSNVTTYRLSLCEPVPNGDWLQRIHYKNKQNIEDTTSDKYRFIILFVVVVLVSAFKVFMDRIYPQT